MRRTLLTALFFLCHYSVALADTRPTDYPASNNYRDQQADDGFIKSSPKTGWGDFTLMPESEAHVPVWKQILLWAPNRVLDFIDIFRVDVGVGSSVGAVLHATEYGQIGARFMLPSSYRVGLFGRRAPWMVERSDEYGASVYYVPSKQRKACKGEVGFGVDLGVGANVGVCVEEVADFFAGIFFFDIMDDDLR